MPGSGKSTWGKKLAKALQYDFVDLDKLIEQQEKISIEEIFHLKGEEYFRNLEHIFLQKTTAMNNVIISCGGGTPCYHNNMKLINENGMSFYLKGTVKLLVDRILNSKSQRPMFMGHEKANIEIKMEELLLERTPFYEQSNHSFNIPKESFQSFVNKAIKIVFCSK